MSVDLGAGNNALTLANGTNYLTASNIQTLTGGTGDDHVTLGVARRPGPSISRPATTA